MRKKGFNQLMVTLGLVSLLAGSVGTVFAQDLASPGKPRKSEWTAETAPKEEVISVAESSLGSTGGAEPSIRPAGDAAYADDRIIVKYKQGLHSPAQSILDAAELKNSVKLSSIGAEVVELSSPGDKKDILTRLNNDPNVVYAEPNYRLYKAGSQIPNDTYFSDQWALLNTGQDPGYHGDPGTPGIDIKATEAWNITKGSGDVVVAVIDTGIEINHPDLAANIWTNPLETAGNHKDDDGNGLIDDVHGWNFYGGNNQLYNATDSDVHGTAVAGIIAAAADNGIGISGVAPNVKIMPLKFIGPETGSEIDLIKAIAYAEAHGAKIANISAEMVNPSQALKDAIDASGMLFVTAAGNYGLNAEEYPSYPASYDSPNIISVASIDHKGNLLSNSNYGSTSVDIAAPGYNVLTTVPTLYPGLSAEIDNGTYKAIFNSIPFENIVDIDERQDAFDRAMEFLGAAKTNAKAKILLVQDDLSNLLPYGGSSKLSKYTSLLADYAGFDPDQDLRLTGPNGDGGDGPGLEEMKDYDVVIWFTGGASRIGIDNLTGNDQANLTAYLNGGGHLLLTGSYPLENNWDSAFATDVLKLLFKDSDTTYEFASGVPGTIYEGQKYELNEDKDYYNWFISRDPSVATIDLEHVQADSLNYSQVVGTSFAAPHASGEAALILSQDPTLDAVAVKQRIMNSGTRLSSLAGRVASGRMINMVQALSDDDIPGTPFPGGSVSNALNDSSDFDDVYALELTAGEQLSLSLTGDEGTDFDLYLFPPDAASVNEANEFVAKSENEKTSSESIDYTAAESGTYYIDVYAYKGSGSYTLTSGSDLADLIPGWYEESSSALKLAYTGPWSPLTGPSYSGNGASQLNGEGSAGFTFNGNYVSWIASKNNQQGIANVYIDDVKVASPSLYSKTPLDGQVIYDQTVPDGRHTFKIEWTGLGDPNGKKSGTQINIDAFSIGRLIEDNAITAIFGGPWYTNYSTKNLGGSAKYTETAGSYAEIPFQGTKVQLLAFTGPNRGTANIYIDGVLATAEPVDMYSPQKTYRKAVFESSVLSPGAHTLKVVSTGGKNAGSGGTFISVDAISILQ